MKPKVYVDGTLTDWAASFYDKESFWGPEGKGRYRGGSKATGAKKRPKNGVGGTLTNTGRSADAQAVRARLNALTKKAPQVVVKLYGGGKGMKQVREHLRYIARAEHPDGQLALEDERGSRILGSDDIATLANEWRASGDDRIPDISERREALNIVLSMPEGTDPIAVKKAARDFASREFHGHYYAMALHTEDTPHYAGDKDDPPTKHPHVHLIVMKTNDQGRRLNPRKADLQRWREGFAAALNEHGVEAVATTRFRRLDLERGEKQNFRDMNERRARAGEQAVPAGQKRGRISDAERAMRNTRAREAQKEMLRRYTEVTQLLAESEDPTDRVLAGAIADQFGLERPRPPTGRGWHERGGGDRGREIPKGRTGTDDLER